MIGKYLRGGLTQPWLSLPSTLLQPLQVQPVKGRSTSQRPETSVATRISSHRPGCQTSNASVRRHSKHWLCSSSELPAAITGSEDLQHKKLRVLVGAVAAVQAFLRQAVPKDFQNQGSPAKGAMKTLRMAAVVVPFASAGMGGTAFLVTRAIASFLQTYLLLLFLRVLLSWFPTFNWERQPWLTLRQMTDPYLQLFRGLIPPLLGMIDFTPLLGFFVLQWISGELQSITMEGDIEEFW